MCLSPKPRAFFQHQHVQKWSKPVMFCAFSLPNVLFATAACIFSTSARTKVVQTRHVLCIFTSKCAFRHSRVHFFNISTYKSGPNPSCFVHFHFQMCFSPQPRAFFQHQHSKRGPNTSCFVHFHFQMCFSPQGRTIFRHQTCKKCFEHVMFCTFSLPNVLFATAACNFSTSELQKVVQTCGVLYILTCKCAFRHSGVRFLISPLSTDLRTRRLNRPTFRLTRHTNHWKNTAFRDFSNIWRGCIFFLLTFALLHLLSTDLATLLLSQRCECARAPRLLQPSTFWDVGRHGTNRGQ